MKHATITEATSIRDANLTLTQKRRRRPMHKVLVSFSAAYFAGALVTDIVYWQMPDVMWERFSIWLIAAGLGRGGCDDHAGDPKLQIGANRALPAVQQYLMPPMRVAKVVGWGKETPTVPAGLQVHALATGFQHPRSLYVLPNGDVLVVESNGPKAPIYRPKDIITGWVQSFAGAKAQDANRITLLRGTKADGTPELRTVFLDHLNSPFGVALEQRDAV